MKCPVDDQTLVMSERQGVEIDYCPDCRGVWLDRGELDKILERAAGDEPRDQTGRDRDDDTRLSLLGSYLENIKGTVFRQTQFAEFELRVHEMAEKGQPLTGEVPDTLYLDITRRYYGHDAGVCIVDDYVKYEWATVPHFYRSYYVFQYATSFTAAEALAAPVIAGDKAATKKYLDFISAGGSKYPIDLLRELPH